MGEKATASCGAVIAHHTAPLGQVLKSLRNAEKRAKNSGRNAFAIDLLKRSGGAVNLTCPWFNTPDNPESLLDSPMEQLIRFTKTLAETDQSRRRAYIAQERLRQLPPINMALFQNDHALYESLLQKTLADSLNGSDAKDQFSTTSLVNLGLKQSDHINFITHFIGIAEFLARESRSGGAQ
jgi:CRISPR-associated protein Cmr2